MVGKFLKCCHGGEDVILPFSVTWDFGVAAPSPLFVRTTVTKLRGLSYVLDEIACDVILVCLSLRFREGTEY